MQDSSLDILCFGRDSHLVYSRELILRKAGHSIVCVDTSAAFRSSLLRQPVRLVLLCQTLSEEECYACEAFAKEHQPSVLVLIFFNQQCKCIPGTGGVLLRSASGPAMLLDTVRDMLQRSSATEQAIRAQSFNASVPCRSERDPSFTRESWEARRAS